MSQVLVGQIIQGGWNFAPRNFAMCQGQLIAISQNQALFSLLGTTFGGNGVSTFALPNLGGRVAVGTGQSPGGSVYTLGEVTGTESTSLTVANLPSHTPQATFAQTSATLSAATSKATLQTPDTNTVLARSVDTQTGSTTTPAIYAPAGTATTANLAGVNVAGTVTVAPIGNNIPFSNMQPTLAITQVIALYGVFPSRN